jgi:hypothetical protein
MPGSRAGSDYQIDDTQTMVWRENELIWSSDRDQQVTQYQPIMKDDIPDWVNQCLEGIDGE